MASRKHNKKVKKPTCEHPDDADLQLTEEAIANSPGAERTASPPCSGDDAATDSENDPVSLKLILKELKDVGREVKEFRKDTRLQLQDIRNDLDKVNERLSAAEARIDEHEEKLQNTDEILSEMISTQEKLLMKCISFETHSRREILRIYGVPEGGEMGSPSMIHFVEKLLRENLNLPPTTALQIQRAHRATASLPPKATQPRSIVVKFSSFSTKEEVLKLAWQNKGFLWNGSKINLDHDYPPEVMTMRKEYAEARRTLKEKNIRFRTLFPARLKIFYEDGVKTFNNAEEVTADLIHRGLLGKAHKPPAAREKLLELSTWQRVGSHNTRQSRGATGYKERLQVYRRKEN